MFEILLVGVLHSLVLTMFLVIIVANYLIFSLFSIPIRKAILTVIAVSAILFGCYAATIGKPCCCPRSPHIVEADTNLLMIKE